jgi:hypothetical protein
MSRARDVADVQDNLGGAVPPFVAGKNVVINGGFDIWQRGTSFSTPAIGTYLADRFTVDSAAGTYTISQQTTGAPTGSRYVMRVATGASSSFINWKQFVETANVATLWGQTVTVSAKYRRNSSFTTSVNLRVYKSATVDAGSGATWTQIDNVVISNANMPTGTTSSDWYTAKLTVAIPNDGTANSIMVYCDMSAVQGSGAYYEVGQVQLEIGSVATPFARAGGTIQGELAACQRYYYRLPNGAYVLTTAYGGGGVIGVIQNPVPMRVAATSTEYSSVSFYDGVNAAISASAVALWGQSNTNVTGFTTSGSTGLIQYRPYIMQASYLGFNAEL